MRATLYFFIKVYTLFIFYSQVRVYQYVIILCELNNEGDDYMNWKEEVRTNITKASGLREYMNLTDSQIEHLDKILSQFTMTVTRY